MVRKVEAAQRRLEIPWSGAAQAITKFVMMQELDTLWIIIARQKPRCRGGRSFTISTASGDYSLVPKLAGGERPVM